MCVSRVSPPLSNPRGWIMKSLVIWSSLQAQSRGYLRRVESPRCGNDAGSSSTSISLLFRRTRQEHGVGGGGRGVEDRAMSRPTCISSCSTFRPRKFRSVGRSYAASENEIERSSSRPDCPARIGRTRCPPKCLSQSSFVFVATDTALIPSAPSRPASRSSPSSLLILPFCLLLFLSRFATRLARASTRSFYLWANVRGIVRHSVPPGARCRRKSWSRWGAREDGRGGGPHGEETPELRAPKRARSGSKGQTRVEGGEGEQF